MKWLSRYSPFLIYYEIPYGRASVELQLKNRSEFPTREWESKGIAPQELLPVLDVIAKQLNLPNHFFLPDDPLSIVLIADYDDFPVSWLAFGLRESLGVAYRLDELARMVADDTLIVELFVRDVLRRVHTPAS